ncbi:MAG TPA: HNH endonuclease signature motif containing protein [Phycisphaerae bacterium]|nr:HNH endonuclease signature motif containing protein [Phycisphaerae bacterium]
MRLKKSDREQLRMKFGGRCAYCGIVLPERGWHADHVEPVMRQWYKKFRDRFTYDVADGKIVKSENPPDKIGFDRPENDTLENLFPSCAQCNHDKHCMELEAWRKIVKEKVAVCRRNYSAFRHAERFGLLQEVDIPVVFWFEKFVFRGAQR